MPLAARGLQLGMIISSLITAQGAGDAPVDTFWVKN